MNGHLFMLTSLNFLVILRVCTLLILVNPSVLQIEHLVITGKLFDLLEVEHSLNPSKDVDILALTPKVSRAVKKAPAVQQSLFFSVEEKSVVF